MRTTPVVTALFASMTLASITFGFSSGDRVQCTGTNVNVRSCASTSCSINGQVSSPTRGTVVSGPFSDSGFTWYNVNWDSGISGYTVQDFFQLVAPAPTLSSISPNPVTGSNSPVTFTLTGSNFVSGAKVQVAYAGNGYTFVDTSTNATFVNSTRLTVPITTQVQADTWHVRVRNPDGQLSGQIDLVVTVIQPAPTLSSISPNPVTGSNNAITFTLTGSNFVSGAKVQVAYAGNGYTFVDTSTNATFVNSTRLTVPITTQVQADTWHVRVRNPDGQLSGQIDLVVTVPAPTLSTISPNPVAGSNSPVTFTLTGSNFVSGAKVQVAYAGNGYTFVDTSTNATFVSSTTLTVPITTQVQADTWHVRVKNPGGQLSGQIDLVVTVTQPAPTLSSINPNPVAGSNNPVTFTLTGTNFVSGAKVQVAYAGNGYTFVDTTTNATFVNSTGLTVPITTQVQADTWHVRVRNPDGQLSGQIDLVVTVTQPAPTLSTISPNPVTGSNSPITFTLTGSNFVSGARVQVGYASNGYAFVDTNTNATFVNSTTVTVPIITSPQADIWHVRVKNPDGQFSGQINLVVNGATSAPTLNTISPNPVLGSNNPTTFTLTGSNFVSGAKVQVGYASNGYTFVDTNTNATFVNSTTVIVPITTTTQADTWHVRIKNPDGQLSGQINLFVNAPSVPTLNSVNPDSVVGTNTPQSFTLVGSNFDSNSRVQVAFHDNNYIFQNTNATPTVVSSSQLTVPITTGLTNDTWRVRVKNSDGQFSNERTFDVTSSATGLSIFIPNPSGTPQRDWGQPVRYTVLVKDSQGRPVEGAIVSGNNGMNSQQFTLPATDPNGETTYDTRVPNGIADGSYEISFQVAASSRTAMTPSPNSFISRLLQIFHLALTPTVTLNSPGSGEILAPGESKTVTATSNGTILSYRFEFSINGGPWQGMAGNPVVMTSSNASSFQWTVPNQPSTACRARVAAEYVGGTAFGQTNEFTITAPIEGCSTTLNVPMQSQSGTAIEENKYDGYRLGTNQAIPLRPVCTGTPPPPRTHWGYNSNALPAGSIRDAGCLLTCLSMLTSYWNRVPQQGAMTPDVLNGILAYDHGLDGQSGDMNPILATKNGSSVGSSNPMLVWKGSGPSYYSGGFSNFLNEKLCAGVPVIVKFFNHFVVVTGKDGQDFRINDPGRCPDFLAGNRLSDAQTRWGTPVGVYGYVIPTNSLPGQATPTGAGSVQDSMRFAVNTNAEILVVDPLGSRTGYDASSGAIVEQIPKSSHFVDFNGDAVIEEQPTGSTHSVLIEDPTAGIYEIQIIGQQDGGFKLLGAESNGTGDHQSTILGATHPGVVTSYFFNVGASSDLSITSDASTNPAHVGEGLTYTLTVTNSGATSASGVNVIDTLPAGVSFASASTDQYAYDAASNTVTFALNSLDAGATAIVMLTVKPVSVGTLMNSATVSSFETETAPGDNRTSIQTPVAPPPVPTSAYSRKTHGGTEAFDIGLPLTGSPGIECRSGGVAGTHQVIVNFAGPVTMRNPIVTSGAGGVASYDVSGSTVTVNLTGISNAQSTTVTLFGVNVGTNFGSVSIPISFLLGDMNGNGFVSASDVNICKAQVGAGLSMANFRADVNANGSVTASDVNVIKAQVGSGLSSGN